MNKNVLGLMLAATVAMSGLAGCQSPAQSGMPTGGNAQVSPAQQQQAGAQTSQATAQAMAEERETENYGYLADDAEAAPAGYAVMMVGQPKPKDGEMAITVADGVERDGEVNITAEGETKAGKGGAKAVVKAKLAAGVKTKLEARKANLKVKAKAALDKLSAEKDAIGKAAKAAKWVDNGDGTESKTIEFGASKTVNAKAATRTGKMVRTRNIEDKTLVATHYEISATRDGVSRTTVRDKVLQEDGSYKVTFHSEMTFKDGTKRVADWTKTISADGAVSGTGTIVWTGKMDKTVNLNFGGTEEAETATATDPATETETTVTTTVEGTATATVKDTETNQTTTVAVEANADAAVATDAASTEASASASTEASAETPASPAPEASASPAAGS